MLDSGIPLAYINPEIKDYEYNIETVLDSKYSEKEVAPYQEFDTLDQYIFDENKNIIDDCLREIDNKYYYIPNNMIEFIPDTFTFKTVIKKNLSYYTDRFYNLRLSLSELDSSISNKLITIFGDAPKRGISPSNVSINNQKKDLESFIDTKSFSEIDFLFISSNNGKNYNNSDTVIDFEELLSNNINIWLSVESFNDMLIKKADTDDVSPKTITASNPTVYNVKDYPVDYHDYYFDLDKVNSYFDTNTYEYSTLFIGNSPILILHRERCGYIIVSHSSLLNNVSANSKIIYETLMNIYLKSYVLYNSNEYWITSQLVDKVQFSNEIFNRCHEEIPINYLLTTEDCVIDEYEILEVTTDSSNIIFSGITSDNNNTYLNFMKINLLNEPEKKKEDVFYLGSRKTIFQYSDSKAVLIESGINITYTKTEEKDYIIIAPCISSEHKIYNLNPIYIFIPDYKNTYYLYSKDNIFSFSETKDLDNNYCLVAIINKIETKDIKNIDLRLLGGGLPEKFVNDYDLIDIGNPKGRPYRVGSTLVITLPEKLKPLKNLIEKEVYKHSITGELIIFVFKD